MSGALWAVACHFNPARTSRRAQNFRAFREHLGISLAAVELGYDEHFELEASDADVLVQIRGRDIMWQKERLLNLAIEALPASCDTVAWIDADVVFDDPQWFERVPAALETFALVRPFETATYAAPEFVPTRDSGIVGESAKPLPLVTWPQDPTPGRRLPAKPWGKAWVARRSVLEEHGLYDACVVGGGDIAIAFAAAGQGDAAGDILAFNDRRRAHYQTWARGFGADIDGRVGYLPGSVHHLWHGALADRRYGERHAAFAAFDFDPASDLARSPEGCLAWATDKPEMHGFVREYLISRNEDGASP